MENGQVTPGGVETSFMLGFVLLASFLAGTICERFRLPRITGFILAGILFGPFVIDVLSTDVQVDLDVFVNMSFAFIGLAAGAELRAEILRKRARSMVLLIVCTTLVVGIGVALSALLAHPLIPFMAGKTIVQVMAICGLVGVVAVARSPSSAIAIIAETKAKGPFTETILGVAMSMDIVILPLFSVMVALSALAFSSGQTMDVSFILAMCGEIAAFIVIGILIGAVLAAYIKYEGRQISLIVLAICFLIYKSSFELEHYLMETHDITVRIEPLLICAAAGFTVQNLSKQGHRLLSAMNRVNLPVFVVFFTMAGAALNMGALARFWPIALGLVMARLVMIYLGCRLATRLAGDPVAFRRYSWMGFVTQAGLSIALATQIGATCGEWGRALGALLIAAIAVNQIIGPVAFKYALGQVGETRKRESKAVWATTQSEVPS
jgi:Kef-type K+ transport system membrane component KefB